MPAARRWVKVWDLPTRVFHWLLVGLVAVGVVTGFLTPERWMGVHVWAGYGLVALIVFRFIWGFWGPEYSRLVSFLYPPRRTLEHLRGLLLLQPPHYIGHNPTGALMVLALGGVLLALVLTGLLVLGGEEKQGPLATVVSYALGSAAKPVHRWLVYLLLVMVTGHVVGVLLESLLTSDNLVRAIITGWKQLPPDTPVPTPRTAHPWLALVLLLGLGGATAAVLQRVAQSPPPYNIRLLSPNPLYQQECGACHAALHPSLLPAASWLKLMHNLEEHFGENAVLEARVTRQLTLWLVSNAAETFDTEAANRFRRVAAEEPYRVSATPYWVRKHADIAPEVFRRKSIQSRMNCQACHRDAASGRFDDQAIAIPEE
ncbi:MAG: cytochrome b/b6 domain-containing protein [Candidatus Tectimicrobiota bacterium]